MSNWNERVEASVRQQCGTGKVECDRLPFLPQPFLEFGVLVADQEHQQHDSNDDMGPEGSLLEPREVLSHFDASNETDSSLFIVGESARSRKHGEGASPFELALKKIPINHDLSPHLSANMMMTVAELLVGAAVRECRVAVL